MTLLAVFAIAFVGTHFLMSHPFRAKMVDRFGENGFRAIYSLISLITFAGAIWAYRNIGDQPPLWTATEPIWIGSALAMWFASVLLAGSFTGNPALPGSPAAEHPQGVLKLTRHPMMWAFATWALVHAVVIGSPKALLLDTALFILAVGGSIGQDAKKRKLVGEGWHEWTAQTAFFPFGRGFAYPGAVALIGGTLLFVFATWLHPMPVGIWRWIDQAG
jgi:uncharacterized membrane protein